MLLHCLLQLCTLRPLNINVETHLGQLVGSLSVLLTVGCLLISHKSFHTEGAHAGEEHLVDLRTPVAFRLLYFLPILERRHGFVAGLVLTTNGLEPISVVRVVVVKEALAILGSREGCLRQNLTHTAVSLFETV